MAAPNSPSTMHLNASVHVEPHPAELPLMLLVAAVSLGIWAMLVVSIIGIVYAVFLGVFFFFAHVALITYVRGSAVRLSSRQLPDLYRRVYDLAARAGVSPMPDAYVMQADGALNAFATKFLRSHIIVLHTDLLDACADDEGARDMIIGHELGHVRSRHLNWHLLLLPGMLVPFLGSAYSRARELTCDRWGAALTESPEAAVRGLVILAAGRRLAPQVDVAAYVAQQSDLETGWMTIGRWLSGYPPLSTRVEAIGPPSVAASPRTSKGEVRAAGILAAFALVPVVIVAAFISMATPFLDALAKGAVGAQASGETPAEVATDPAKDAVVNEGLAELERFLLAEAKAGRDLPNDQKALLAAWQAQRKDDIPRDPYAGAEPYGYLSFGDGTAMVFSAGPDGELYTDDDINREVEPPDPR